MFILGLCGIKVYGFFYLLRIGNFIELLSIKVLCLFFRRILDRILC